MSKFFRRTSSDRYPALRMGRRRLGPALLLLSLLITSEVFAANCTAIATGDWDNAGTWNCVGGGGDADGIPDNNDDVFIDDNNYTVTIPNGYDAEADDVTIGGAGGTPNNTLTLAGNGTLTVDNVLECEHDNNNNTSGTLNVNAGTVTTSDLRFDGASTTNATRLCTVNITTGLLDINDDILVNEGSNANNFINITGAGSIRLAGEITMGNNDLTLDPGTASTFFYDGPGAQQVDLGYNDVTYHHLVLDGSGTKTSSNLNATGVITGNFTVDTGVTFDNNPNNENLDIGGNVTVTGTIDAGDGTWNVGGNFTRTGTFNSNAGTFIFDGGAAQQIGGTAAATTTFNNLTLSNANGLSLAGTHSATVNATLNITTGRIATGNNLLTVNGTLTRCASTTDCFVVGNLVKPITAGAPTIDWEVGTETASPAYTPVSIAFTGATAGTFQVTTPAASGDHADTIANTSGIDAANSVNQYWTLTTGTATFTGYAPTFTYADVDGSATPANFIIAQKASGTTWEFPVVSGTPTFTTAIATGVLTADGDVFAIGNASLHVAALSAWHMDETAWDGTASEVADNGSGGYDGTAASLSTTEPTTDNTSRAISGSPGTCRYGVFNRTNKDYIAVPGSFPNLSAATGGYTITAWIRTTNNTLSGQRIMLDDQGNANGNWGFSLGDPGAGRLRFFYRQAATFILDTPAGSPLASNTWYFVAASVSLKSGTNNSRASLYAYSQGGALVATNTANFTVTSFAADGTPASIGGETNASGENTSAFGFGGNIDEVGVYETAYTAQQVNLIRQLTHTCIEFDHIRIEHDGEGLTCNPETVTVRACSDSTCSSEYSGSVTTTLLPTGWVGGDTITFTGNATAQLRRTTIGTLTLDAGGTTPNPTTATRCFNGATETCDMDFVESGFIFDVPDLTACKTSVDVTITAVKASATGTTCVPAFESGTRAINFWSTYSNPNAGTQQVSVNGTAIDTDNAPGTDINLAFGAGATTTITVRYPDAGQMQLNAHYAPGSGSEANLDMSGIDSFISVPVGLAVYSSSASCTASDATGPVCAAAGSPFNLNVKAACWTADGDTDLSDNPATPNFELTDIPVTHTLIAPAGGQSGALGTSTFDFVAADNGIHVINQTISEVGVFTFTATPPDYLGQAIAAATSPDIGRFRPAHFELSNGTLTNRIDASCSPASNFTYMGENLELGLTLTAQNTANVTTENYRGAFAKLDPTDTAALNIGAIDSVVPTPLSARIPAPPTISSTGAWGTPSQGVTNILASLTVNRLANPDGPYTNVRFGVAPVDSDGVALNTLNLDVNNDSTNDRRLVASSLIRFGRMFLENAFGSELLPLNIPLRAEYYRGTQFTRNAEDSCTTYNSGGITFNNRIDLNANPVASGSGTLSNGLFTSPIQLSPPGADDTGSVDAILSVPPYLDYDWNNDSVHNDDPRSKATFGIYGGPEDNQIYIREVY